MKTQTERTLNSLENNLRNVMEAEGNFLKPQVRCCVNSPTLRVFIQHRKPQTSDQPQLHRALSQSLRMVSNAIQQDSGITYDGATLQGAQVMVYYEGQRYPYAKRSLLRTAENHSSQSALEAGAPDHSQASTHADPMLEHPIQKNGARQSQLGEHNQTQESGDRPNQASFRPQAPQAPALETSQQSAETHAVAQSTETQNAEAQNTDAQNTETQSAETQNAKAPETDASSTPQQLWNRWLIIKATAAGVALAVVGVSTYALTRPCVIGGCSVLVTAQTLNEESHQLLSTVTDPKEVVAAYEKLVEANYQLARIPFWSAYYDDAQHLLIRYQADADVIAQIVQAQRQAYAATLIAQEAPHPLAVWEEIRGQWQEAIAQLDEVPLDTTVANLASIKRTEYQTNLSTIDQRISQEQDAQTKIIAARQAAQIAEDRESTAESAENWQLVYVTWQVVINRLDGIPKDTMAYAEAQHLYAIYSARLTASRDRYLQEQLSYSAYTQALALAEQAMQNEDADRLTEALVAWQNVVSTIQQIPEGTSYYEQAQPLLTSYSEELARTEDTLNRIAMLERYRPILNQACTANVPVCSYTLGLDGIQIFMVESYAERLRQFFIAGLSLTDSNFNQSDLARQLPKMTTLLQTITAIGNESQIAVELFDSESQLIATYDPSVSGYVQPEAISID